jgi:hypothetical protein
MSTAEQITAAIAELPPKQVAQIRAWWTNVRAFKRVGRLLSARVGIGYPWRWTATTGQGSRR